MKKTIKIAVEEAKSVLSAEKIDPKEAESILNTLEALSKDATPWWVIVLKVLAYAIGLLLAGYGTTAAAATLMNIM